LLANAISERGRIKKEIGPGGELKKTSFPSEGTIHAKEEARLYALGGGREKGRNKKFVLLPAPGGSTPSSGEAQTGS